MQIYIQVKLSQLIQKILNNTMNNDTTIETQLTNNILTELELTNINNKKSELQTSYNECLLLKELCIAMYNDRFHRVISSFLKTAIQSTHTRRSKFISVLKNRKKRKLLQFLRVHRDILNLNTMAEVATLDPSNYIALKYKLDNIVLENNPIFVAQLLIQHYIRIFRYYTILQQKVKIKKYKAYAKYNKASVTPIKARGYFRTSLRFRNYKSLLFFNGLLENQTKKHYSYFYLFKLYKAIFNNKKKYLKKLQPRKSRKQIFIYLNATHTNFFITITDEKGNVKSKLSTGIRIEIDPENKPRKKANRKTTFAISTMAPKFQRMLKFYMLKQRNTFVVIRLKGYKYKIRELFRGLFKEIKGILRNNKLKKKWRNYIRFQDLTSIPHNGCRHSRKPRK